MPNMRLNMTLGKGLLSTNSEANLHAIWTSLILERGQHREQGSKKGAQKTTAPPQPTRMCHEQQH